MSERPVERRPGAFIFEQRMPQRERIRWTIGCSVTMVVLLAASGLFLIVPGVSDDVRTGASNVCFVFSWLPPFFIVMMWIAPQQVLRVSPRSISFADTYRRRKRWRLKWSDVHRVLWRQARSALEATDGTRRNLAPFHGSGNRLAAMQRYLEPHFDLSAGTIESQAARRYRDWPLWRKVWDKVVLVLLVLGAFSTMIAVLLAETVLGGLGLLLMAALWGVAFAVGMWIHKRREARQWISRRAL